MLALGTGRQQFNTMKTYRLIGMALFAVLMSVGFTACSGSDDDDNGGDIEGTWYLKTEIWYAWKNGQPDMQTITSQKSYADYEKARVWVIKKDGENLNLVQTRKSGEPSTYTLEKKGTNEYKKGSDRVVVKSVSAKQLVVDYYDGYYSEDENYKEYGVYTFMK